LRDEAKIFVAERLNRAVVCPKRVIKCRFFFSETKLFAALVRGCVEAGAKSAPLLDISVSEFMRLRKNE